ncbi:MAG: AraC family ligand binding domain-containing protein, partial [Lentisphaeraceae bacterium]|nr:AraC family ligand binding domain-containing protein [Lentisphaeraceae bacterium]
MDFKYSDILKNNVKYKRVVDTLQPISLKHIEVDCLRLHDVINNHEQWLDIKQKYLREYDPDTGLHVHSWHEFSVIDYGEIEYYTEKKRFVVKDQGFFFMPPGIRHGWVPLTTDYLILGFHLKFTATSIVGERILRELEQRLKEKSFHIEATGRVRE